MNIAVVGTGYVGLVSAACFAELGHTVYGVDIDAAKVEKLKNGQSPIYEPGLEELIQQGLKSGRLSFTTQIADVLPHVQIVFCAVATPSGEGHKADLRAVFAVTETVANQIDHDLVFVNKSTVPVGTGKQCEERIKKILETSSGRSARGLPRIAVVSNPEFLREGMAVSDTMMPDRIVVGLNGDDWAKDLIEELYRPITRIGKPIVFMNRESAEIVKYASNSFLATKISFINMMSELAEKTGADIRDIARGMGLDDRIGPRFLHAGIGYGGSCFPKDVKALMATAKEYDLDFAIIEATDRINQRQRHRFTEKIIANVPKGSTIAILGLSFKPKTDDMRDAPSLDILPALMDRGYTIRAYDPAAMENARLAMPFRTFQCASSPQEAAKEADALVVLTEWDEFRGINLKEMKSIMKGTKLFDARNIYEPSEVQEAGLEYFGIGVP